MIRPIAGYAVNALLRLNCAQMLPKHQDGSEPKWSIAISGGNMQPNGLGMLVGMCRPHRKTVNDELRPLIKKRWLL